MKVLVINASANKERSTTLKLTKTFLEGLDVEASEVEFVTLDTPMLPAEAFVKTVNGIFEGMMKKK